MTGRVKHALAGVAIAMLLFGFGARLANAVRGIA